MACLTKILTVHTLTNFYELQCPYSIISKNDDYHHFALYFIHSNLD